MAWIIALPFPQIKIIIIGCFGINVLASYNPIQTTTVARFYKGLIIYFFHYVVYLDKIYYYAKVNINNSTLRKGL